MILNTCKVPWTPSPSTDGLTLSWAIDDQGPECSIVFGGGRYVDGFIDCRRIEINFFDALEVQTVAHSDEQKIEDFGFRVIGIETRFSTVEQHELEMRKWETTGLCPDPRFYFSKLVDAEKGEKPRYTFVLAGRDCYVQLVASGYSWGERMWTRGSRDVDLEQRPIVAAGSFD